MEVKSYRAKSLQEALRLVQQDLGPDAAVLKTREVWPGLLGGMMGQREIEVTASTDIEIPSRFRPTGASEEGGFGTENVDVPGTDIAPKLESTAETDSNRLPTIPPAHYEDFRAKFRRDLQGSMQDLSDLVSELKEGDGRVKHSAAIFKMFTDLVDADVNEELARELVGRLQCEAGDVECSEDLKHRVHAMIKSEIAIQGPINVTPESGRVVALVGPTGVGKTTTIAKLAANFRLRDKRRVGLITVDTYRIAAVEQLRTYADIIDLPMEVVSTPREMREAINRLSDLDLILMDTAGRSPRDEIKIRELKTILTEAQVHEVHLVLSSTSGPQALVKTAERFAEVGTTALVLTKLDESTGLGNLISLWRTCGLPMSYVTNGQNVPDDIQSADADSLAWQLLGNEAVTS
ncbi:MAG: flagellar biosynthesis protein FlhF [Planctomycetota bacterium]